MPTPENVVVPAPYTAPELSHVDQGKVDILQSNARIAAILEARKEAEAK